MVISSFQGAEGFRHAKRQSAGNARMDDLPGGETGGLHLAPKLWKTQTPLDACMTTRVNLILFPLLS